MSPSRNILEALQQWAQQLRSVFGVFIRRAWLTVRQGVLYFSSLAAVIALQRWPSRRRSISLAGLVLVTLSLVVASFSTQVFHLILTQGALYGLGGAFLYSPFVFYLDEWFIERKGLAFGVLWAGTGISGAVVPIVMDWGLEKYGFRTMLRAWAMVIVRLDPNSRGHSVVHCSRVGSSSPLCR